MKISSALLLLSFAALFAPSHTEHTHVHTKFLQHSVQQLTKKTARVASELQTQIGEVKGKLLGGGEHVYHKIRNIGDFLSAVNPPLQDNEALEVVVLRAFLQKDSSWYIQKIVEYFNANHGGIGFIRKDSGVGKDQLGGAIEVQMSAEFGFVNALMPGFLDRFGNPIEVQVDQNGQEPDIPSEGVPFVPMDKLAGGSLNWNNTIVIDVANKFDMTYWDEMTPIGTISGRELKLLDCWLPQWKANGAFYQLLSVHMLHDTHPIVKEGKVTENVPSTNLLESHTCWDFVSDCVAYLKGVQHSESTWDVEKAAGMKKSNTKVLTDTLITPLVWGCVDENKQRQILEYYDMSFAHKIAQPLLDAEKYAYVFDKNKDTYWQIKLAPPLYTYAWELVDWTLHGPMVFGDVCGAPKYDTKFISPFDSMNEIVRAQERLREKERREREERRKNEGEDGGDGPDSPKVD
eukprot:GDKI01040999.1.p1 GENE.GDKI01040999.1~~GDKI01040999.1.p1  ORF type:complete len:460 (+),score=97.77 GDKI01040999.1:162-1541(+)